MQDRERETLKAHTTELANLMTENVPFLLRHYMQSGVLNEAEREDIIQKESSHDIKIKLVEILIGKENVSLKAIIEGLNATENHCVSKEIQTLLSSEEVVDDGSGDKQEDLSVFATNLVDEVIAKAEKTTGASDEDEEEEERQEVPIVENGNSFRNDVDDTTGLKSDVVESDGDESGKPATATDVKEDEQIVPEKLVEASVQVHTNEEAKYEENNVGVLNEVEEVVVPEETTEDTSDVNGEEVSSPSSVDVPDRSVNFSNTVATVIDDGKNNHTEQEEEPSSPSVTTSSPSPTSISSPGLDAQNGNESENEDVDNIDIEQEFVMPTETGLQTNGNHNNGKMANGNDNDDIQDNGNKADSETETIEDAELAAILAKKELVRKQVEMFEKKSPGGGKVNYVIRTAKSEQDKEQIVAGKQEGDGSNVKNLKNFFQRLSTAEPTSSPTPAPAKSVGKLKVTFPATS